MPRQHRTTSRAVGTAAGTGGAFLGFDAYTAGDSSVESPLEKVQHAYSQRPIEVYAGSNADVHVAFRLIGKTAATSQVKGLQALGSWLESAQANELMPVLKAWLYWFQTLALSNDRHVRVACFQAHTWLVRVACWLLRRKVLQSTSPVFMQVKRMQKVLARYLPTILPVWVLGVHDAGSDVSAAAMKSFLAAFPCANVPGVLALFATDVLPQLVGFAACSSAELSSTAAITQEDAAERASRVRCSALSSIAWCACLGYGHSGSPPSSRAAATPPVPGYTWEQLRDDGATDELAAESLRALSSPDVWSRAVSLGDVAHQRAAARLALTVLQLLSVLEGPKQAILGEALLPNVAFLAESLLGTRDGATAADGLSLLSALTQREANKNTMRNKEDEGVTHRAWSMWAWAGVTSAGGVSDGRSLWARAAAAAGGPAREWGGAETITQLVAMCPAEYLLALVPVANKKGGKKGGKGGKPGDFAPLGAVLLKGTQSALTQGTDGGPTHLATQPLLRFVLALLGNLTRSNGVQGLSSDAFQASVDSACVVVAWAGSGAAAAGVSRVLDDVTHFVTQLCTLRIRRALSSVEGGSAVAGGGASQQEPLDAAIAAAFVETKVTVESVLGIVFLAAACAKAVHAALEAGGGGSPNAAAREAAATVGDAVLPHVLGALLAVEDLGAPAAPALAHSAVRLGDAMRSVCEVFLGEQVQCSVPDGWEDAASGAIEVVLDVGGGVLKALVPPFATALGATAVGRSELLALYEDVSDSPSDQVALLPSMLQCESLQVESVSSAVQTLLGRVLVVEQAGTGGDEEQIPQDVIIPVLRSVLLRPALRQGESAQLLGDAFALLASKLCQGGEGGVDSPLDRALVHCCAKHTTGVAALIADLGASPAAGGVLGGALLAAASPQGLGGGSDFAALASCAAPLLVKPAVRQPQVLHSACAWLQQAAENTPCSAPASVFAALLTAHTVLRLTAGADGEHWPALVLGVQLDPTPVMVFLSSAVPLVLSGLAADAEWPVPTAWQCLVACTEALLGTQLPASGLSSQAADMVVALLSQWLRCCEERCSARVLLEGGVHGLGDIAEGRAAHLEGGEGKSGGEQSHVSAPWVTAALGVLCHAPLQRFSVCELLCRVCAAAARLPSAAAARQLTAVAIAAAALGGDTSETHSAAVHMGTAVLNGALAPLQRSAVTGGTTGGGCYRT